MLRKLSNTFSEFFNSQKSAGILLIGCTTFSILLANSPWSAVYTAFWDQELFHFERIHLPSSPLLIINDVLMAVFFLLVGLEIKREVIHGELSSFQRASLPVAAALGGMIVPAAMYFIFNQGTTTSHGWGIPMATDIAFAIGILSILGSRVPDSLKILLTALAVADDLGAVGVIAICYSNGLQFYYLLAAAAVVLMLFVLNRRKVNTLWPYLSLGVVLWYLIHASGIHATVAGVLLAMTIPFEPSGQSQPLLRLEHALHIPVNRFIMPLFALANTALLIDGTSFASLSTPSSIGIITGLVIGKPLGIILFVLIAVRLKISRIPEDLDMKMLAGAGMLGGIGFTMSIFISLLAFDSTALTDASKLAILLASLLSGLLGYYFLKQQLKRREIR